LIEQELIERSYFSTPEYLLIATSLIYLAIRDASDGDEEISAIAGAYDGIRT